MEFHSIHRPRRRIPGESLRRGGRAAASVTASLICLAASLPLDRAIADEGAAAGASAVGTDSGIANCNETLGTIRLEDDQAAAQKQAQAAGGAGGSPLAGLAGAIGGLTSILSGGTKSNAGGQPSTVDVSLDSLRLLIQESNCFIIVERHGAGDAAAAAERDRVRDKNSEIVDNSSFQKGQEFAADFALVAHIVSVGSDSKFNVGLGGLLPGKFSSLFGANASTSLSQADVMLVLDDLRHNAQVSIAKGHGEARNLNLAGNLLGKVGKGLGGESIGYSENTPNGKLILQAYADAYTKIVPALNHYKMQTVRAAGGPGTGGGLKMQGGQSDAAAKSP